MLRNFAPTSYVRIRRRLGKRLLLHGIRANVDTWGTFAWLFALIFLRFLRFLHFIHGSFFLTVSQIAIDEHWFINLYAIAWCCQITFRFNNDKNASYRIVSLGLIWIFHLSTFYFVVNLKKFETLNSLLCSSISSQCKEVTSAFLHISAMHASGISLPDLRMTNIGAANFCRARLASLQ